MKKKYLMFLLILSGFPLFAPLRAQDSVRVSFTGMDPHLDQVLTLYLRDSVSRETLDTVVVDPINTADFEVTSGPIVVGNSYFIDFYADYNENAEYDIPPVDHAWRIVLDSAEGDTTVDFAHNTDFTDISWPDSDSLFMITVNFIQMSPHLGQDLYLYVRNMDDEDIVDSLVVQVDNADFSVDFDSVASGDYNLDFYADHNTNGDYDSPPTDHAWRIELEGFDADTVLEFVHNTEFTDIFPDDGADTNVYQLAVNFTGMTPHIGQDLFMYIRNSDDGEFVDSLTISPVDEADFNIVFDSVPGGDYNFDFYADLNQNGSYDVPPTDHAWRIELEGFDSDTTLDFAHNTEFTDIFAVDTNVYNVTVDFTGFEENEGQNFFVYLRNPDDGEIIDSVVVSPLDSADFTVEFDSVRAADGPVHVDFYTDANNSGTYDAPPVDHAWRIELDDVKADTVIAFAFDSLTFTDIELGSAPTPVDKVEDLGFSVYPNPATDELNVQLLREASDLSIYNVAGALVLHKSLSPSDRLVRLNVSALKSGMYILKLKTNSGTGEYKFLKK